MQDQNQNGMLFIRRIHITNCEKIMSENLIEQTYQDYLADLDKCGPLVALSKWSKQVNCEFKAINKNETSCYHKTTSSLFDGYCATFTERGWFAGNQWYAYNHSVWCDGFLISRNVSSTPEDIIVTHKVTGHPTAESAIEHLQRLMAQDSRYNKYPGIFI